MPTSGAHGRSLEAAGFEVIKQYDGQEQVDLKVEIEIPGSWFAGGAEGALTEGERREKYHAQAVEFAAVREFPGANPRAKKVRAAGIRFICISDAAETPDTDGYWMLLTQWNRYRHYTYKERRNDELPFIKEISAGEAQPEAAPSVASKKSITDIFTLKDTGTHQPKGGKPAQTCRFWVCTQLNCKLKGVPIKELLKNTGQLFRHLKQCNHAKWQEYSLASSHSKLRMGEDGAEVQVRKIRFCRLAFALSHCSDSQPCLRAALMAAALVQGVVAVAHQVRRALLPGL